MSARTLPGLLLDAASQHPERPFLTTDEGTWTYGEAARHVMAMAGVLAAKGVAPGERVALYLENGSTFVVVYLAALAAGAAVVPINSRYRSTELAHILGDAQPAMVFVQRDLEGNLPTTVAGQGTTRGPTVVALDGGFPGDEPALRKLALEATPLAEPLCMEDGLAVIGYTSGTTGPSKGAMLSHANFVSNSFAVTEAWGWTEHDHLLLVLPLFHMHGLAVGLHGTLARGARVTLHRRFDAAAVIDTLMAGEVTMFFGVPTLFARLVAEAERRNVTPRPVRLLVSGSAPLAPHLLEAVEGRFGGRILERYGMTETVMNAGNPLTGERRAGTVGFPFAGVEIEIRDDAGAVCPAGETGQIHVRGPNVFRGYWRGPAATAEAFTADGFFRTGDLGYRDEDGYLVINGRARELVISGGFNVYPREVEEVLEQHSSVAEAAVLGLPDPDLGERVVAAIVPDGTAPSLEELVAFCGARLAGFKKPRALFVVDALPRNALGKIQKHVLLERLRTGPPHAGGEA